MKNADAANVPPLPASQPPLAFGSSTSIITPSSSTSANWDSGAACDVSGET